MSHKTVLNEYCDPPSFFCPGPEKITFQTASESVPMSGAVSPLEFFLMKMHYVELYRI